MRARNITSSPVRDKVGPKPENGKPFTTLAGDVV